MQGKYTDNTGWDLSQELIPCWNLLRLLLLMDSPWMRAFWPLNQYDSCTQSCQVKTTQEMESNHQLSCKGKRWKSGRSIRWGDRQHELPNKRVLTFCIFLFQLPSYRACSLPFDWDLIWAVLYSCVAADVGEMSVLFPSMLSAHGLVVCANSRKESKCSHVSLQWPEQVPGRCTIWLYVWCIQQVSTPPTISLMASGVEQLSATWEVLECSIYDLHV